MGNVDATRRPLGSDGGLARSSAVVSVGLLFATLVGAGQAFLLLFFVREGPETDGFLAVYSVYVAASLLGVSLRRSLVPLLGPVGEDELAFRDKANELLQRVSLASAAAALLLLAASPLIASFLTEELPPDARRTALTALLILSPAAYLQMRAGAVSGVLNAVRRFPVSVGIYVGSSLVGLVASAVLLHLVGVLGAPLGVLVGAASLHGGHSYYARRRFGLRSNRAWRRLADRAQLRLLTFLLSGSTVSLAQQLTLTVALAAVARANGPVTTYTYAYFIVIMMTNLSSYPVALVALPGSVEAIARSGPAAARGQVLRPATYIAAVLAPMMAAYAGFGEVLLRFVFGSVLSSASLALLYVLGLILLTMVLGYSVFVLAGSVLLALGYRLRAAAVSGFSIAGHAVLLFGLASRGPEAVAWGHGVAALLAAGAMLAAVFAGDALRVAGGLVSRAWPAFALSTVFLAAGWLSGGDRSGWIVGVSLVLSTLVYCSLTVVLRPSVAEPFLRLLRLPVPRMCSAGRNE